MKRAELSIVFYLLAVGCSSVVETAPHGATSAGSTSVSSSSASTGVGGTGGEGGHAPCQALIQCPPGQRCGYDPLKNCSDSPTCHPVHPCNTFDPGAGCRCSDNVYVGADCETGLFPTPTRNSNDCYTP